MGKITLYMEPALEHAARELALKQGVHKTQEIFREAIRFWVESQTGAHQRLDEVLRRGNKEEIATLETMLDIVLQQIDEREHGKEADANVAEVFRYVKKRARIIAEHRQASSRNQS